MSPAWGSSTWVWPSLRPCRTFQAPPQWIPHLQKDFYRERNHWHQLIDLSDVLLPFLKFIFFKKLKKYDFLQHKLIFHLDTNELTCLVFCWFGFNYRYSIERKHILWKKVKTMNCQILLLDGALCVASVSNKELFIWEFWSKQWETKII